MDKEFEIRLVKALERLSIMLAIDLASKFDSETDLASRARRLQRCGFTTDDVAAILNTTTNSIAVAKHRKKKSKKSKTRR